LVLTSAALSPLSMHWLATAPPAAERTNRARPPHRQ
jgi:hypothetical protein